jgi:cleavage and polyadenylation specificity factor subunit 4
VDAPSNKRKGADGKNDSPSKKDSKGKKTRDEEEEQPAEEEAGEPAGRFTDETLSCRDCNAEFVFTVGEQEFYEEKGFTNKPTRCKACKDAKKGGASSGGFGGGGERSNTCYAFQKGSCDRGSSCRFSHDAGGGGGGGGGRGRGGDRGFGGRGGGRGGGEGRGGGGVCYAFQKGNCDRGSSCRFSH